jgi:hypothetical protein
MSEKDTKYYVMCDCESHALVLEQDDELKTLYVSPFIRGFDGHKLSISDRLRWCWMILTTGLPWCDFIILNVDKVKHLKDQLEKFITKVDNNEYTK